MSSGWVPGLCSPLAPLLFSFPPPGPKARFQQHRARAQGPESHSALFLQPLCTAVGCATGREAPALVPHLCPQEEPRRAGLPCGQTPPVRRPSCQPARPVEGARRWAREVWPQPAQAGQEHAQSPRWDCPPERRQRCSWKKKISPRPQGREILNLREVRGCNKYIS